jgi:hypothetical protein
LLGYQLPATATEAAPQFVAKKISATLATKKRVEKSTAAA